MTVAFKVEKFKVQKSFYQEVCFQYTAYIKAFSAKNSTLKINSSASIPRSFRAQWNEAEKSQPNKRFLQFTTMASIRLLLRCNHSAVAKYFKVQKMLYREAFFSTLYSIKPFNIQH